jgi:lysyl-tRNA synthetase class I
MAVPKTLTAAQTRALALIAAGGVRRIERGWPFRVVAPDGTRIADVTVRALTAAGLVQYGDRAGVERPMSLTETGATTAPAAPADKES